MTKEISWQRSPLHVLVIDDDADTRINLKDILELDDYQVETACTAAAALARRHWEQLSAIILDRKLPDGTAEELLPKLRALAPQAAVIIVTGYADVQGAVAAIRQGAADYILKPINPYELRPPGTPGRTPSHRGGIAVTGPYPAPVLETINDAVLVVDEQGRVVLFNPAVERIIGPVAVGAGPEGWPERGIAYLGDGNTLRPPNELALALGFARPGGHRRGKAHSAAWVAAGAVGDRDATALKDDQGRLKGAVAVLRDISDAERSEEAGAARGRFRREPDRHRPGHCAAAGPPGAHCPLQQVFRGVFRLSVVRGSGPRLVRVIHPAARPRAIRNLFQRRWPGCRRGARSLACSPSPARSGWFPGGTRPSKIWRALPHRPLVVGIM